MVDIDQFLQAQIWRVRSRLRRQVKHFPKKQWLAQYGETADLPREELTLSTRGHATGHHDMGPDWRAENQ